MPLQAVLDSLASWLDTAELAPDAIPNLNERYLHHWFTHSITAPGRSVSFAQGQVHPEWPTRKLSQDRPDGGTYNGRECTYNAQNPARGAGHIDFALGTLDSPEVLLEFKWNGAYAEWQFDFLKMMDPRLRPKGRICFGVLPRGWHSGRADRTLDLTLLNKQLQAAARKSRDLMENPPAGKPLFPFTTRFYCVAMGKSGGKPMDLIRSGHARLDYCKFSSEQIGTLDSAELTFNPVLAMDCKAAFQS